MLPGELVVRQTTARFVPDQGLSKKKRAKHSA
jgi:hypothetical protein